MDRLAEMEAFVNVVDNGGFTEAARKLGVSKSAISKSVSSLEARLAVRLLNRTTRRVSPTEVGLAYYDRARAVLKDALDADSMVTAMQDSPQGSLRISVPVSIGMGEISDAVAKFLTAYPNVEVNLVLDDRFVELVAEGFDMAIRIGVLSDSSLMARKLAEARVMLVASPEYLRTHGTPATIDDLNHHHLLHYSNQSTGNFWRLRTHSGEERHIRVGGRFTANNANSLMKAVEAGIGISRIPSFVLGDAIRAGRLVELLPDSTADPIGIYAVYPPGPFPQPKLRAFIDFLVEYFRTSIPESNAA
ncbi:MAG: LysR family transcriptional regulator [Rhodobacteraceae bacterium]|uniref:LysR family transcriptional regulator n=1 Tax=Amaricoccus sp. B4 TaxID=3368557 RepID=UPI000DABEA14|nr:LysR family transcriptional regulator [Paracoccaceae bacterium]